jgi:2-polyprenyl-3-methyl-5-hydroxy-6-metoxy-1,4-benzoquinol methylase
MPSTWFAQHRAILQPGTRVLDIACGRGRHAIAAAELGAAVTGVDGDAGTLREAEQLSRARNLSIEWLHLDLENDALPAELFDVVMVFYYLDRRRMSDFVSAVKPRGFFVAETYLEGQREIGGGPTSDDHLLKAGELISLVQPLEVVLAREVLEHLNGHSKLVASVLAERRA